MKSFYDIGGKSSQNIPSFLSKYVKQWGSKVAEIPVGEQGEEITKQPAIAITPAMKKSALYEGQPMFQLKGKDGKGRWTEAKERRRKKQKKPSPCLAMRLIPPPSSQRTANGTIRRSDIIRFLEAKFVPIRTGRFRGKALGIFKVKPEVIRSKIANDIPVIAHEIGHYLDKVLGLVDPVYDHEMISLGKVTSKKTYTTDQIRKEGVAEFMRLYLTDPAQAKKSAPDYYAEFETILDANEDIKDILLTSQRDIHLWYNQSSEARVAAVISSGQERQYPQNVIV